MRECVRAELMGASFAVGEVPVVAAVSPVGAPVAFAAGVLMERGGSDAGGPGSSGALFSHAELIMS